MRCWIFWVNNNNNNNSSPENNNNNNNNKNPKTTKTTKKTTTIRKRIKYLLRSFMHIPNFQTWSWCNYGHPNNFLNFVKSWKRNAHHNFPGRTIILQELIHKHLKFPVQDKLCAVRVTKTNFTLKELIYNLP